MPDISLNEIAYYICADTRVGVDGCCNQDRTNYVCEVMGTDAIDLMEDIDYRVALTADDPEFVQAAIHLAKLQMLFVDGARLAGWIDEAGAELRLAWFELMLRKMGWHLHHLQQDIPTPPFTFLH